MDSSAFASAGKAVHTGSDDSVQNCVGFYSCGDRFFCYAFRLFHDEGSRIPLEHIVLWLTGSTAIRLVENKSGT